MSYDVVVPKTNVLVKFMSSAYHDTFGTPMGRL
jgi:hypothetical protein